MIEVAHEILHQRGETMAFADLTNNEIQAHSVSLMKRFVTV